TGYGSLSAGGPGPAVHNAWGIRKAGTSGRFVPEPYSSWQAGIEGVARLLGSYRRQGLRTPEQIVGYYAYGTKGRPVPAYSQYIRSVMGAIGGGSSGVPTAAATGA